MVKGLIPELAVCPFCRQHQFSIYMDPAVPDSKWMHCGGCHFSGDCVELYGRLKGSPNLTVAVRQAMLDGYSAVPDMHILGEDIETYVNQFPTRRKEHKAWWDRLRAGLKDNLSPDVVNRLQADHLWGGWCYGYQDRMLRFMGAGTRKDILEITGFADRVFPREMFKTALALNFQDAPGRICAFMFVGDSGFRVTRGLTDNVQDGGLAMLDALLPHEKTVYAVDDPIVALHIQRKQFSDHPDPLKFVVYNYNTSASWSSVSADRVVLWSRVQDWNVFNHARRVRNGYVTSTPHIGESMDNLQDYLKSLPMAGIMKRIEKDARPWPEAFCTWLTSRDVSEAMARDAILKMELTPGEKQTIAEACPKDVYDRVMALMGESRHYVTKVMNGHPVTEREDGLYVFRQKLGEERIVDALVRVESEICDRVTGKVIWKGHIRFKGTDIPYQAPAEIVERQFKSWLSGCTVRAGLGAPIMSHVWAPYMAQAAKMFSAPRSIESLSHIGVQVNGDVLFPQFKIVDGFVRDISTFFGDNAPAARIPPPLSRTSQATDSCNPARSCWIALAAAYSANLMVEERQLPVLPVVLAGPYGSIARTVGRQFAKAADMPILPLDKSPKACDLAREKLNPYGYPSYVETSAPGQLRYYPVANRDNVVVAADILEAAAFAVGGRWLVIQAPKLYSENCLPPLHDVFLYLADLQRRDYDLNAQVPLHEAILEDFCDWYARYLCFSQADTLAEARGLMQKQQPPGDCLLNLCYWLYSMGEMPLHRHPFMAQLLECGVFDTKEGIIMDEDAKKVFVSRRRLFKSIKVHQLPLPDVTMAVDDLVRRKLIADVEPDIDGWIVDMDHWNAQAKAWKAAVKQTHS